MAEKVWKITDYEYMDIHCADLGVDNVHIQLLVCFGQRK